MIYTVQVLLSPMLQAPRLCLTAEGVTLEQRFVNNCEVLHPRP